MTHRRVIFLLLSVLIGFGLWWLLRSLRSEQVLSSSSSPQEAFQEPQTPEEYEVQKKKREREIVSGIVASLNAPIEFHGKVVDQNGDPVPNARVGYGLLDKFNASGSNGHTYADASGYITISGVKGAAIRVSVNKDGYYSIHNVSNQVFGYGSKPPPTKDNPAIFVLHKMGETESLIPIGDRTYRIPRDGTPVEINLTNGKAVPTGSGNLRVEVWTDDQVSGKNKGYQWRCQITVPHGGLIERNDQFDFEAPADGYEESVELGMPANAEQWAPEQQRDYFVKLPDGRFARINFRMIAQGDHFFGLESFLNPQPGSRNLEYDPKQTVKTP